MSVEALSQRICDLGKELLRKGLVARTWGNISLRLTESEFLITPSGLNYQEMTPQHIVKVSLPGLKWTGSIKPSSEVDLHGSIYSSQPRVKAVLHTHPASASVIAACRRDLPIEKEAHRQLFGKVVPHVPYSLTGTKELGRGVTALLEKDNYKALVLSGHGALLISASMDDLVERAMALEEASENYIENRAEEFSEGEATDPKSRISYFLKKNRYRGDR